MNSEFFFWILLFFIGLALLLKAADLLSDSAEKIGLAFKIPKFIVGVTIVSIGTSLPELITSLVAVSNGVPDLVIANAIGSNITNMLLILGLAAIFSKKIQISYDMSHVDLPIFVGSSFFVLLAMLDRRISLFEAVLMVLGLAVYLVYTSTVRRTSSHTGIKRSLKAEHKSARVSYLTWIHLIISGVLLFIAAEITVEAVQRISLILNVKNEYLGITAFALGTSLPEMAVILRASVKGYSEIVVGSILGSSIFNIFGVIGISALLGTLYIPDGFFLFVIPLFVATNFLYLFITQEGQITKWEGWLLLIFYIFFIGTVAQQAGLHF